MSESNFDWTIAILLTNGQWFQGYYDTEVRAQSAMKSLEEQIGTDRGEIVIHDDLGCKILFSRGSVVGARAFNVDDDLENVVRMERARQSAQRRAQDAPNRALVPDSDVITTRGDVRKRTRAGKN